MDTFFDYMAVAGASLAFLYFLETVLTRRPARGQRVGAAFHGMLCVYLLIAALEPAFTDERAAAGFFQVSLIAYTALGPLGLIYVRMLFDLEWKPIFRGIPAIVPAFALLVIVLQALGDFADVLAWFSFGINMVCFAWTGYLVWRLSPGRENRALYNHVVGLLLLVIGVVAADLFASYSAGATAAALLLLYGRVLKIRRPDLRGRLEVEGVRRKYANSKLTGLDREALRVGFERLLAEERLFAREGLTLTETAALMDLSPHQLSELVNVSYQKSFKTYLNEYRVRDAHRALLEEPERDVTAIAFDSGFNSLSSFYRSMKSFYGESPREIRARAGNDA